METDHENLLIQKIEETFRCRNCNYCYSRCPLYETGEGFMVRGPSGITQSVYYMVKWKLEDAEEELLDVLSRCTTCNSCVIACKELAAGMPVTDIIESGRALLVERGSGPPEAQAEVLEYIYERGNSYGENPIKRKEWLSSLSVPKAEDSNAENLLYLGCSISYDPELRKIAEHFMSILKHANVEFCVSYEEPCCGCITKRVGDFLLFEEISQKNSDYFDSLNVKRIITISPHAYNVFLNEYPELKGKEIIHYTQFLWDLISCGRIKPSKQLNIRATYHDPCYLGKRNGVYEEPREIIKAIPGVELVEMTLNRKLSFCCGGGGGGMWLESQDKKHRLSNVRIKQAIETGANTLVVACPWCYSMLSEEARDREEAQLRVMDIAELVAEATL